MPSCIVHCMVASSTCSFKTRTLIDFLEFSSTRITNSGVLIMQYNKQSPLWNCCHIKFGRRQFALFLNTKDGASVKTVKVFNSERLQAMRLLHYIRFSRLYMFTCSRRDFWSGWYLTYNVCSQLPTTSCFEKNDINFSIRPSLINRYTSICILKNGMLVNNVTIKLIYKFKIYFFQ